MGTSLFAFYGSLRMGMSNYKLFEASLEFIRSTRLSGYKLYSLQDYPYAVRSENAEDSIVVEIFRTPDSHTQDAINKLELDAGYIVEKINIDGDDVIIYLFENIGNNVEVKGGDWVESFGK